MERVKCVDCEHCTVDILEDGRIGYVCVISQTDLTRIVNIRDIIVECNYLVQRTTIGGVPICQENVM